MPSNAFQSFKNNLEDIERIKEAYNHVKGNGRGKRSLDHFTRSGILLLAAYWELYIEEVLTESVEILLDNVETIESLPKSTQHMLYNYIMENSTERNLLPLRLANDGWKKLYKEILLNRLESFHTPKTDNINSLFKKFLGCKEISRQWSKDKEKSKQQSKFIDSFISHRGEIAHRGKSEDYQKIDILNSYIKVITEIAILTDNYLTEYLAGTTTERRPWNRIKT